MADVVVDPENTNSKQLLGQGIKAYILQDYETAVTALSKASELLVAEHGDDLHESLGEVYLYYGKALLGLSREEPNVLGDGIPKDDEESDEEEEEAANGEDNAENEENKTDENAENVNEDGKKDSEPQPSTSDETNAAEEGAENTNEAGDEEPSDLQVAWEVLELAKKIYSRQGEDGKRQLAETLIVLGEISLESENFSSAIEDIKQGLEIQKTLYDKDSRKIAETYYKLGVAYSTDSQIDEAIDNFNSSVECLKNREASLDRIEDKKDDVEQEIKEIRSLIPDIKEKITDMKTYKNEVCQCDIRTTIKNLVEKPEFVQLSSHNVNKLEVKRRPDIETALKNIDLEKK